MKSISHEEIKIILYSLKAHVHCHESRLYVKAINKGPDQSAQAQISLQTCSVLSMPLLFDALKYNTVKPVLRDLIKQGIFLAFQTGGCLLLYESSAESSSMSFLHYFHTAISNHLSEKPKICLLYMVA